MEAMFITSKNDFSNHLLKNSEISEPKKLANEFCFSKVEDIVIRSQIDCKSEVLDNRSFDIKVRATYPIRMDSFRYKDYTGYKFTKESGLMFTQIREYYDLVRSAFLKWSLQARLGNMHGLFGNQYIIIQVCYHTTLETLGFQYLPLDKVLKDFFGSKKLADESFNLSMELLKTVLENITKIHTGKNIRITIDTTNVQRMFIYVESINVNDSFGQNSESEKIDLYQLYVQSTINNKSVKQIELSDEKDDLWKVQYVFNKIEIDQDELKVKFQKVRSVMFDETENNFTKNGTMNNLLKNLQK